MKIPRYFILIQDLYRFSIQNEWIIIRGYWYSPHAGFRAFSTPPHPESPLPEYISTGGPSYIKIPHGMGMDWAVHQFKKAKAEDNEPWWTKSVSQGCLKPKIMTVPSPRLKNEEAKSEKRFINPSFSTSCLKGGKKNELVSQSFQHWGVLIVWKQEKYFTNE